MSKKEPKAPKAPKADAVEKVIPPAIIKFGDNEFTVKELDLEIFNKYQSVLNYLVDYEDIYTSGINLKVIDKYRGQIALQYQKISSFKDSYIKSNPVEYTKAVKELNEKILKIYSDWQADNEAWGVWLSYQAKLEIAKNKTYSSAAIMREFIEAILQPEENIPMLDWNNPAMFTFIKAVMARFFILMSKSGM